MRASESDRGLICPASLVRPRLGSKTDKANKAAEWGNLCHRWKETGNTEGNKTLNKKLVASAVDREKLWPAVDGDTTGGHEVTFSVDLSTLQLRIWSPTGSKFSRDDWKLRHPKSRFLTGTIDYLFEVCRKGVELPWVDDLKTGNWPVYPKTSKQLRSYALVPWILSGCETDVWVSITQWKKYRLDGKPKRSWHLLTSEEIAKHLARIRWAVRHPEIAIPHEEACKFCECKTECNEYLESDI
jgi:hypothetical protein